MRLVLFGCNQAFCNIEPARLGLARVVDDRALSKEILQAVAGDLSSDRFRSAILKPHQHTADPARIMVAGAQK